MKQINWFKNPKNLSEIYQQTGIVFTFATKPNAEKEISACHEWVKCRDFLHDAVRAQLTGKPCSIYGFGFDPKVNPNIDIRKMRMLVSKNNLPDKESVAEFKKKMVASLGILNHFEAYAKVALSKMEEVEPKGSNKKTVFLFTSSAMWMKSPFLVSMYTFLIRLGDKELKYKSPVELRNEFKQLSERKTSDNDQNYLKTMWETLHPIIANRTKLFPMKEGFHNIFHGNYNISSFHNQCGILSLSKQQTPDKELNDRVKEVLNK